MELSGGENQKLALARTLYRNRSAVLLDEPTSNLDPISERSFYKVVFEQFKYRIVVAAIHDIRKSYSFDRILLFDNGHLIASGTAEELLKSCDVFQEMVGESTD